MLSQLRKDFLDPAEEYTPFPFWFWNGDLREEEIIRQIHDFKNKGIDGFVIHPRMGITEQIEYLSDRFLELVQCAVEEAAQLGMKVVLYDEGMYPSGSAHGMVVKANPRHASRGLKMMEYKRCNGSELYDIQASLCNLSLGEGDELAAAVALPQMETSSGEYAGDAGFNLADSRILYPESDMASAVGLSDHSTQWVVYIFVETYTGGHIRGVHFGEDDGEPAAPPSADLLNPEAAKQFIRFTHERYFQALKEPFGSTVIGMFTDEPSIMGRGSLPGLIPWTGGFLNWYLDIGGSIRDLPALWMDIGNRAHEVRRQYQKAVHERLELSYYQPISQWCEDHGIALMGHPEASDDIGVLKYFHVPGQDVVWRWVAPENGTALEGVHSTQAKCSSDAARHRGRRRNSNECFGCCGPNGMQWAFTMDDMKWYMDWLFVRGVNMLFPHAFFYSIEGERRLNERPPDVGPNNLWWLHYRSISQYIRRMSWLMTDSINTASAAVLCEADHLPWEITKPLYENQIEFNYLEENLLIGSATAAEDRAIIENGTIRIREQKYNVLIIEGKRALQPALTKKLHEFLSIGGNLILFHSDLEENGLQGAQKIDNPYDVIHALDSVIQRDVVFKPTCKSLRMSHVVKEGVHFYLLVNEGENPIDGTMSVGLSGIIEQWDGWSGETKQIGLKDFPFRLERRQSTIFVIDPCDPREANTQDTGDIPDTIR
jgi:hypothetical protein